jgi:hypothetical protein
MLDNLAVSYGGLRYFGTGSIVGDITTTGGNEDGSENPQHGKLDSATHSPINGDTLAITSLTTCSRDEPTRK